MTRYLINPVFYMLIAGYFVLQILGNVELFHGAAQLLLAMSGEELPPDEVEQIIRVAPDEMEPVASYPAFGGEDYTNSMMQRREVDVPTSLISLEIAGSNPAAAILVSNGHVEQARENGHV